MKIKKARKRLPKHVLADMDRVLASLDSGGSWTAHKGKRLLHDRTRVSIPLRSAYRLLVRDTGAPIGVFSHEDYSSGEHPG